MKNLFLIRGLPGSGKTTLAEILTNASEEDAYCVAADDWMTDLDGNYRFDPSILEECHSSCQQAVEFDMADGVETIVVHNTMSTETEVEPYLKLATKYGYQVFSMVLENRHGSKSVHSVPDSTLDKMRRRFSIKL